jgi:hypothetical protein
MIAAQTRSAFVAEGKTAAPLGSQPLGMPFLIMLQVGSMLQAGSSPLDGWRRDNRSEQLRHISPTHGDLQMDTIRMGAQYTHAANQPRLERFRAKWVPVRVKKTRQSKY